MREVRQTNDFGANVRAGRGKIPSQVRKLPVSQGFLCELAALGKVLILAREEVVAALLGLMVELRGLEPLYLARADVAEDVIRRERPAVVVVDCDHQDCTESLIKAVREAGAKPVLFSPFRFAAEVNRVATRHGVASFTLPTDPESFGRVLSV